MPSNIRVTVWNEYRHERNFEHVAAIYPQGIHTTLAEALHKADLTSVHTATLDEPEHGLTAEILAETDVLIWWGHIAQREVSEAVTERIYQRVLDGMGLIVLHAGHNADLFKKLMGTSCKHKWREENDHERLWVVAPGHPIAAGLGEYVDIGPEEMYGEHFDVPPPEELVFVGWFSGGEVFRSGCCYTRGYGKIFYFQPGHQEMPTYHHPEIQRIIVNAVGWAAPTLSGPRTFGNTPALEHL
jgi:trehalose utilization protein